MQQINLYQDQFRVRRDRLDARHLAAALVLLLVVLAGVTAWLQFDTRQVAERAASRQAERDGLEQEVLALQSRLDERTTAAGAQADATARLRQELAAKQRVLEYLESGPIARRDGFSAHLHGLARRVVDDLWLERIVFERGGDRLRLEGHALRAGGVPQMIAALGDEAVYSGHAFRSLVIERPADAEWRVDFVLSSDAPQPPREDRR